MMKLVESFITPAAVIILACIMGACAAEKGDIKQPPDYQKFLTTVNPDFMITASQALAWHQYKDKLGPTYSGNKSWHQFLSFTKKELKELGVKDITHNEWTYERWHTSDWPDDGNWSLESDGRPVKVAHYGAYSGLRAPQALLPN